jgi:hypothetical protein
MSLFYSIKTRLLSACTIGFLLCQTQTGWAQLNVITTTEDIAALWKASLEATKTLILSQPNPAS